MQINRTASDDASTRQCHFRLFVFTKQCTQQIIRCTNFFDIFIIDIQLSYRRSIDARCMTVYTLYHCSNVTQCIQHNIDIAHIRQIIYGYCLIRHNGCCKNRESCILSSSDLHFPYDRIAPFDYELFHITPRYFYFHGPRPLLSSSQSKVRLYTKSHH